MTTRPPSNTSLILKIVSDIEKKLDDFEQRIRSLEKAHWSGALVQSVMTSVITAGIIAVVLRML
jgi:hypothetical protein